MSASARVQKLLAEVDALSEDERTELELALLAQDPAVAQAWADEIDRRARRALGGEARGMTRSELEAVLALPPSEARERLTAIITARR